MTRSHYPFTSDPSVVAAQRGSALAKSVIGAAVVMGLVALTVVTARDQSTQYLTNMVEPHALPPSGELDHQLQLDPSEIADYRSNVHG